MWGERPLNNGIAIMTTISRKIAAIGSQMIASGPRTGSLKGLWDSSRYHR